MSVAKEDGERKRKQRSKAVRRSEMAKAMRGQQHWQKQEVVVVAAARTQRGNRDQRERACSRKPADGLSCSQPPSHSQVIKGSGSEHNNIWQAFLFAPPPSLAVGGREAWKGKPFLLSSKLASQ